MTSPNPSCPNCGAVAVWHADQARWGCNTCRQYLELRAFGAPTAAAPVVSTPFCPRCGSPTTWHAQVGKFGCDTCREYLEPVPLGAAPVIAVPPPMQPSVGPSAGMKVLNVVVAVIAVIMIAVIKVGCRHMLR